MSEKLNPISPGSRQEWRAWLEENHHLNQFVWVICSKKDADSPTLTYKDAIDEALCYGWIDSTAKSLDGESYLQSFTKRKSKSVWSKINKEKVERLINDGLMTKTGLASIEVAKGNGYWSILDEVEELIIPKDLENEFSKKPRAKAHFLSLSRSDKKRILQWLVLAQRPETRQKRINEVVESGDQNLKPKQFN